MCVAQRDTLDKKLHAMESEIELLHNRLLEDGADKEIALRRAEAKTSLERGMLMIKAIVRKRRLARLYRGFSAFRWFGLGENQALAGAHVDTTPNRVRACRVVGCSEPLLVCTRWPHPCVPLCVCVCVCV